MHYNQNVQSLKTEGTNPCQHNV